MKIRKLKHYKTDLTLLRARCRSMMAEIEPAWAHTDKMQTMMDNIKLSFDEIVKRFDALGLKVPQEA